MSRGEASITTTSLETKKVDSNYVDDTGFPQITMGVVHPNRLLTTDKVAHLPKQEQQVEKKGGEQLELKTISPENLREKLATVDQLKAELDKLSNTPFSEWPENFVDVLESIKQRALESVLALKGQSPPSQDDPSFNEVADLAHLFKDKVEKVIELADWLKLQAEGHRLSELADKLNLPEGEKTELVNALDRLEDIGVVNLDANEVELANDPESGETILTTQDGRELKISANMVLLGLLVLIFSGNEVANIMAKEISKGVSRWVMTKLNIPEEIINDVINRGDVAANFIQRLSTDSLFKEFTQNMSKRELFDFMQSMDEDQLKKMMRGEQFDNNTSAMDHRKFTPEQIKTVLDRLSAKELRELKLDDIYRNLTTQPTT